MLRNLVSANQVKETIQDWYSIKNEQPQERLRVIAALNEIEVKVYIDVATDLEETRQWKYMGEKENLKHILIELKQQESLLKKQSPEAKDGQQIQQLQQELLTLRMEVRELREAVRIISQANQMPPAYQEPVEGNRVYSASNSHPMFASSAAVAQSPPANPGNITENLRQKFSL